MYLLINSFSPLYSLETISLKGATLDLRHTCVVKTWVPHIHLKLYPLFPRPRKTIPTFSRWTQLFTTNYGSWHQFCWCCKDAEYLCPISKIIQIQCTPYVRFIVVFSHSIIVSYVRCALYLYFFTSLTQILRVLAAPKKLVPDTLIGGEKVGSPWKHGYRLPWPWKTWVSFELNTWYPRFHNTVMPVIKCGSLDRDCFQQTKGKKLFISKYI